MRWIRPRRRRRRRRRRCRGIRVVRNDEGERVAETRAVNCTFICVGFERYMRERERGRERGMGNYEERECAC